jgi:pyruvate/2-oxoglutarate dehydrogenase complex dihydrolipoamide acyltransferase (E2) component
MVTEFQMPKLGHAMEEATVIQWYAEVGSAIQKGQVILDVETDKAVLGVETTISGVVVAILAEVGEQLPVGAPLARIEQSN